LGILSGRILLSLDLPSSWQCNYHYIPMRNCILKGDAKPCNVLSSCNLPIQVMGHCHLLCGFGCCTHQLMQSCNI
jgi:hypothetical protein